MHESVDIFMVCNDNDKKTYVLGTCRLSESEHKDTVMIRICDVLCPMKTKKRKRKENPLEPLGLETMERAVKEYTQTERSLSTPFEHGTSFMDLFNIGKETSDIMVRAYHLWFHTHTVHRLHKECKEFNFKQCTLEELEMMNQLFYTLWCTTKKQMLQKMK